MISFEKNNLNTEEKIEEYLAVIKNNLVNKQKENEALRKELDGFKKEVYASEEIQRLKEERNAAYEDLWRGFPITEKESSAIWDWKQKHETEVHNDPYSYHGCSGGGYSYIFYPTGIGTSGVCRCDTCYAKARNAAYANGTFNRDIFKSTMKELDGEFEFQELG